MTTHMRIKSDIEIAQTSQMKPIVEIAANLGLGEDDIELFGKYKAKSSNQALKKLHTNKNGKVILVTSINPTPAGEGKSTVTVGLGDALHALGEKVSLPCASPLLAQQWD